MSRAHLKRQAEIIKLGRLLDEPPDRLSYLEKLRPDDIRVLREMATDVQYQSDSDRFGVIAFASRLLPVALTALIAQKAFGSLLSARIAGVLDTDYAVSLADRMPTNFLADLAIELDPRRCSEIIARMPPGQIAEVAEVLTLRGEHVTMGRFVGHMTDEAITASLAVIDEASLLRISYVLEGDEGLERVIGLMSQDHLRSTIRAATEHDLWPEALDLLGRVSPGVAGRLGDLAAEEDDRVLAAMVDTAQRDELWDAVLPVTQAMTETGRRRFAELPAIHRDEVLAAIVRSAMLGEAWRALLPLVPLLPAELRLKVWSEVLTTAEEVPVEHLRGLAREALELGLEDMLPGVVSAAQSEDLWDRALRLLVLLGPDVHRLLAERVDVLPDSQRAEVVSQARSRELLGDLGPLGQALPVGGEHKRDA